MCSQWASDSMAINWNIIQILINFKYFHLNFTESNAFYGNLNRNRKLFHLNWKCCVKLNLNTHRIVRNYMPWNVYKLFKPVNFSVLFFLFKGRNVNSLLIFVKKNSLQRKSKYFQPSIYNLIHALANESKVTLNWKKIQIENQIILLNYWKSSVIKDFACWLM